MKEIHISMYHHTSKSFPLTQNKYFESTMPYMLNCQYKYANTNYVSTENTSSLLYKIFFPFMKAKQTEELNK